MTNSAIASMRTIDRFLQEVAATEKRAAEAHTEPGSVGGPTTHPSKNVDDSTEEATEGARARENEADVKADEGPASVDNTPKNVADKKAAARKLAMDGKSESGDVNPPGTAAEDQLQIGTKKEPTGEDPAVETNSAKAEKEDSSGGRLGNTTHPARTNNGELDGYKYAEMSIDQLAKVASDMGNNLLAQLANLQKQAELKGDQHKLDVDGDGELEGSDFAALRNGAKGKKKEDEKAAVDLAGQAGWELAGLLSGNFDKKAADSLVHSALEDIIKTASDDADKVAAFLANYNEELSKKAEGEMPVDPAAMGGAPVGPEAEMADDMTGGAPAGDQVEQLAAILEQLGISPEELEAAMAAEGGAGAAPAGAEAPTEGEEDEDAASAAPGMEVSASDKGATKSAKAKTAAAKKGAANAQVRDYIQEILDRSRR